MYFGENGTTIIKVKFQTYTNTIVPKVMDSLVYR